MTIKDKDGNWLFMIPVQGIELTKYVGEEITINRVMFISRRKLPRIRKRLKIPKPLSKIIKDVSKKDKSFKKILEAFFSNSNTYAILPYQGNPKDRENDNLRLVNEELNILSVSLLGFKKRNLHRRIGVKEIGKSPYSESISINKGEIRINYNIRALTIPVDLSFDRQFYSFHRRFMFYKLLKIIRGEIDVSKNWRVILSRTALLIGQSINSTDISISFLMNVIALETILIEDNDKISDTLIYRSEFLLGWSEEWHSENYEKQIKKMYNKRCDFVHNGHSQKIGKEDLLFLDELIFNILLNLVNLTSKIKSKKDLVSFSNKYLAAKTLGKGRLYQFKELQFTRKKTVSYTEADLKEI